MTNIPAGRFITVEGTEGAGKSTCIQHIERWATSRSISMLCTREPGGTPLAEQIRAILLETRTENVDSLAELLLVFAARAQHLNTWIRPNLEAGKWVLSDRFTDATYAYQGSGRGLNIQQISQLERLVQGDFQPDLTLLLDLPVELGLKRARQRSQPDRFELEQEMFFEKVRSGYRERAAAQPDRIKIVDASKSPEQVSQQSLRYIGPMVGWNWLMVIAPENELKSSPLDIPLPWQRSQWQRLVDGFERDLMPHAQIFCGNQGLGKGEFAAALGLYIYCSSRRNGQGCGECRNCRLIRLETHPDFLEIRPEKPSSPIKIDNIRALNDFVNRTSESGVAKIVLIERADQMNRSAANALLKNLEEPPAGTFFFLVTSREMQLPVTIRSRCQLTRFSVPDRGAALEWLGQQTSDIDSCELPILLAAGAPLVALKLSSEEYQRRYNQLFSTLDKLMMGYSNPVTEVKLLLDVDLTELLGWFSGWVGSLIRAQNGSCVDIVEIGYEGLEQLTDKLALTELLQFQNLIQRAFNDSLAASNINKQLILENVLLSWQQAVGEIKRDN